MIVVVGGVEFVVGVIASRVVLVGVIVDIF